MAFGALALAGPPALAASLPSAEANAVHTVNGEGKFSVSGMVNANEGTVEYWFEFLDQAQFQKGSWASAARTTPVQTSGGGLVWQEIPTLATGETYHYRLAIENEAQFKGQVQYSPATRTIVIPKPKPETQPACPNEAVRTGPSAKLPDCRAYEQVTPVNKEGAQDIFGYGRLFGSDTDVGVDGEELIFEDTPAKWGSNVGGSLNGKTSYLFARAQAGWKMTSLYPQPQTGGLSLSPGISVLDTPDLSQVLAMEELYVSPLEELTTVNFVLGPPGGPYTVAASEPEVEGEHWGRWVGESRDGSVAVIQSPDHELIPGERTGTTVPFHFYNQDGFDLYEYSGGRLSQVNVYTDGETIGTCGAHMVQGREGGNRGGGQGSEETSGTNEYGSLKAVSADGSRIFFEADPNGCPSEEERQQQFNDEGPASIELYMREDGRETVDIGNYTFQGANPEGTRLFLSKRGAGGVEYFSYDTEMRSLKRLFSLQGDFLLHMHSLSEDGNVYYFNAVGGSELTPEAPPNTEDIYRYDIPTETLSFIAASYQDQGDGNGGFYTSPDGGDFYFNVISVQGVSGPDNGEVQVYRYDSSENVVQCVSCASPFDPEPQLRSVYLPEWVVDETRLSPLASPASANGDFVFFDTPSALVPQDVDGEIPPARGIGEEYESDFFSPSSDVYEWRRYGIDGCGRAQGCLALITNGVNGTMNVLLGVDRSGRNVFIGTHSQLAPTDTDEQGDIYDARIGGGFPAPPPPPTECEGAACSTPPNAPGDPTQTLLPAPSASEARVSAAPLRAGEKALRKKKKKKKKGRSGEAKHGGHRRGSRRTRGGRRGSGRSSRRSVR